MRKTLVACFSATGTTAAVAQKLAGAAKADFYAITPQIPYAAADLNWNDKRARSTLEMHDSSSRPALADKNAHLENYDVVFLGFPIWWYVAPTLINTFLESYDCSGKTIIISATSGGSGFGKAVESLQPSAKGAVIREGRVFHAGTGEDELAAWLKTLNL